MHLVSWLLLGSCRTLLSPGGQSDAAYIVQEPTMLRNVLEMVAFFWEFLLAVTEEKYSLDEQAGRPCFSLVRAFWKL